MPDERLPWDWESILASHAARPVETAWGTLTARFAGMGDALVLLHGIGSGSGSWAYQLDELGAEFHVIAWDAPGYGGSDAIEQPRVDDYAVALAALMDGLRIERATFVGHSLGALTAARFATKWPNRVRALILADPAVGHSRLPPDEREKRRTARLEALKSMGAEKHADARAANLLSPRADAQKIALVRYNMARLRPEGYAAAATLLSDGDLLRDVSRINLPALVVCGALDRITPPNIARQVAEAFPGKCECREIAGAGHASYVESPQTFNRMLINFHQAIA